MSAESIPLNALPPLALDRFMEQSGFSRTTCWRIRKNGWLKFIVIAGKPFVTRAAIAEFNARAERGEFAGVVLSAAIAEKKGGQ